jgi:hypothetical protein
MKFAYKRFPNGVQRPIIPITIRNPRTKQEIRHQALVDSGADLCIFSTDIAELIGIDVAAGRKQMVSGVMAGETRHYYLHDIELVVGGAAKLSTIAFMPDLSNNGHGLLGQLGFFDRCKFVKFEHAKFTIELGARL